MAVAKKKYGFEPDYAVPPGETLVEFMDSRGMTQRELAVRTGLTVQSINRIFKGDQPITYDTANRLELVTGISARMWNNLEALYREQLSKIHEKERLQSDIEWLRSIPTRELADRGVINLHRDKVDLLREALRFYGVSNVQAWRELWENPAVAARCSKCFKTSPGPASAWIRLGELEAHKIECKAYDKVQFEKAIQRIRELTVKKPEDFVPGMRHLCAESGIALALIPEMKKVPWNGATKWLAPDKAMIILNIRGKTEDIFWFSFFHEAGHVLNDKKKNVYINDGPNDEPLERQADEFAAEVLIPRIWNKEISKMRTKADIVKLAERLGISTGIIVGRFQYLTRKWDFFNDMKNKFIWQKNM